MRTSDRAARPPGLRQARPGAAVFALLIAIAACTPPDIGTSSNPPGSEPAASATGAPPPPSPSPPLTAAAILEELRPSIAFLQTPIGTGSGFFYDERHIVTNAHVVRPYTSARAVLSDGTELPDVRVAAWDLVADLAVLEVAPSAAGIGVTAGSPTTLEGGALTYLVGYPMADPASPEPVIAEGLLARSRLVWTETGLTYLQTDAIIDDGQSGGLILDEAGHAVGVTGSSRGRFALGLSIDDVTRRVDALLAGRDIDGIDDRTLPTPPLDGSDTATVDLRHRADVRAWLVDADQGHAPATVSLAADHGVFARALAAGGILSLGSGPTPLSEVTLQLDFEPPGPFLVILEPDGPAHVDITSTVDLLAYGDPDDGRGLEPDTTVTGVADYLSDVDWWTLRLEAGTTVEIRSSSISVDTRVFVDRAGAERPLATGSDGGGPIGWDDTVRFTAPDTDTYLVVVADARQHGRGAYLLSVDLAGQ